MTSKGRIAPLLVTLFWGSLMAWAQPGTEGHVNYLEFANATFDAYTQNPSLATQQWFQNHFQEMVVWSPYFDTKTSWFPNSVAYTDLYGIPQGSWVQYAHPEWILKDQNGNWLYVPYWCANGSCPEYAGDVANPAFRAWWISQAQGVLAAGNYKGFFLDDTNMLFRVSDGYYNQIPPIDSNTGQTMTYNAWRSYIAQFTTEIRGAFPWANILENVIWFAGPSPTFDQDAYIQQQLRSATQIDLERGVASDSGLTGGTGFWSVYAFLNFIDRVHALGKGVNLLQFGLNAAGEEYGLASYFMISNGTDSLSDDSTNPNNWFSGYSADLGPALGPRTYSNGVFQRNFIGGIALMGEPGLGAQTISLPGWFQRLDGSWVNSVTLGGSQGIILLGSNAAPRTSSAVSNISSTPSSTGGWNSLHGWFTGKAAVGKDGDGRLEVFARGGDNALWHIWQTSAGGAWSGWSSLGGSLTGNPAVVTSGDGRLEVFARGGDNGLWHRWQTSPGGNWSAWASLGGGIQSDPSAAVDQNGRLEVFAQGSDNALWHIWQNTPGGIWSGWAALGGSLIGQPGTVTNWDGRIEVFARGTDNGLWHIWQTSAGGNWSGWSSLGGGIASNPAVALNADGRLEVFALGTDGGLWDTFETSAGGTWGGWMALAGTITANPSVATNADGRLEVFARGTDNALWHTWQTSAGGSWSGWSSLGGTLADGATVGVNADGRLEVFDAGTDSGLWHIWQPTPGSWN